MAVDERAPLMGSSGGSNGRRGCASQFYKPLVIGVTAIMMLSFFITLGVILSREHDKPDASPAGLPDAVTSTRLQGHLMALNGFDTANRFIGTKGYNDSVAYVTSVLQGLDAFTYSVQPFAADQFRQLAPSTLVTDEGEGTKTYVEGEDYNVASYSGSGAINSVMRYIPPVGGSFGCVDSDYVANMAGSVVIVPRGNCTFFEKAQIANNTANKPAAIIISNDTPEEVLKITVAGPEVGDYVDIPVLSFSLETGNLVRALIDATAVTVSLNVTTKITAAVTYNVIAETKEGNPDQVVVVGSHLDSVEPGRGINDNGSGSAANLAIAQSIQETGFKPVNKIRLSWYGAEEIGLKGSRFYVSNLIATDPAEYNKIYAMLNYDMLASINYMRGVYDGKSNDTAAEIRDGSAYIQSLYIKRFEEKNLNWTTTPFSGRSDYGPFIENGVAAGGLFTGAEGVKTQEEFDLFGGLMGASFDECYHQLCDDITNIDAEVHEQMSDAAAYVLQVLALDADIGKTLYPKGKPNITNVAKPKPPTPHQFRKYGFNDPRRFDQHKQQGCWYSYAQL